MKIDLTPEEMSFLLKAMNEIVDAAKEEARLRSCFAAIDMKTRKINEDHQATRNWRTHEAVAAEFEALRDRVGSKLIGVPA